MIEVIRKKRNGRKLSRAEIESMVFDYAQDKIPDYQFAAFLMAVYFQGLDARETTDLMQAMMNSGRVMDLATIKMPKIDKHSTGGVGDKISLILAPLVASCGVCVPMISGRGLGHTGGTLDKLESIPGFDTRLSARQFKHQLQKIGVAIIGQTARIAPADRKIYALRDVTSTVDSIPLIAASIMSKKLAEDLDGLVLDVKFGSGAFMTDLHRARKLARAMIQIGKRRDIKVIAVLTDMNNPLGEYVGNAIEVVESIEVLKGKGPEDIMELTFVLAEQMLKIAGIKGGRKLLQRKIQGGEALAKFRQMIEYQHGEPRIIDDYSLLPSAKYRARARALRGGYVSCIDNYQIGRLLIELGGGRKKKEDVIDPSVGFCIRKKIGDRVIKNEVIAEVYSNDKRKAQLVAGELAACYATRKQFCRRKKLIKEIINL